ncbi:MAG TPA: FlgD immunoglobulin-like domain containing protein [Gemmatimonadales bacterium]|nr:FlgD immunoglobulin-like domain containing protein [Gemmatimonadales bacterium]
MNRVLAAGLVACALLAPAQARAQSANALLDQGVRAYQVREYDGGAWLLRRALAAEGADALSNAGTARALMFLTATEVARNQRDSALAAARRLILLDPRYRPDESFPQSVAAVYQEARRTAPSVSIRASGDTAIRPGAETFVVRLGSSTAPEVTANVLNADGRVLRTIFSGTIRDSVDVRWNGLDGSGNVPAAGRYMIVVTPRERGGRAGPASAGTWTLRLPIELARPSVDTAPLPPAPPDSLFRPERGNSSAAVRALIPGLVAGVAIVALPNVVASGEDASKARLVVGGAVTIAGIAAFFSHHPGRRLPENERYNRNLRETWQRNSQEIARRNADRMRQSRMIIRPGAPSLVTSETP